MRGNTITKDELARQAIHVEQNVIGGMLAYKIKLLLQKVAYKSFEWDQVQVSIHGHQTI